ncbi:MAG TPA: hypothetical protein VF572_00950 [Candidatus Saccharimonadales bacterium]|jgi:hypothetical protein
MSKHVPFDPESVDFNQLSPYLPAEQMRPATLHQLRRYYRQELEDVLSVAGTIAEEGVATGQPVLIEIAAEMLETEDVAPTHHGRADLLQAFVPKFIARAEGRDTTPAEDIDILSELTDSMLEYVDTETWDDRRIAKYLGIPESRVPDARNDRQGDNGELYGFGLSLKNDLAGIGEGLMPSAPNQDSIPRFARGHIDSGTGLPITDLVFDAETLNIDDPADRAMVAFKTNRRNRKYTKAAARFSILAQGSDSMDEVLGMEQGSRPQPTISDLIKMQHAPGMVDLSSAECAAITDVMARRLQEVIYTANPFDDQE